jgi:hypothetical protein
LSAVTIPLETPIDATNPFADAHVPPVTVLLNVAFTPKQILVVPAIAGGAGFTVIVFTAVQPDASE